MKLTRRGLLGMFYDGLSNPINRGIGAESNTTMARRMATRMTRREFNELLLVIGVGGVLYLSGCGNIMSVTPTVTPQPTVRPTLEQVIDWSFLEEEINVSEPEPPSIVVNKYVPLGSESILKFIIELRGSEYNALIDYLGSVGSLFEEELRKRNLDKSSISIGISDLIYGVPTAHDKAESLAKYCKEAKKFLYQNLQGLEKHNIDWTVLNYGDNYSENSNQKGFVGNSHYELKRIIVYKSDSDTPILVFYSSSRHVGGIVAKNFDNKNPDWSYIFIGTGSSSIVTPFSEIIPLTAIKKYEEHIEEVANELFALQALEAVTEAIAIKLSSSIIKEFDIPNGDKHLENYRNLLAQDLINLGEVSRYRYVPEALKWANINGIQNTFDLYMKSPAEFMKEIGAYRVVF